MTDQETKDWAAKRWDQFSDARLYQLRKWKQNRKDRFLAMLGSPAPEVVTNTGALMTAIDDSQDALFTLGGLGVLAMRFSPPPVAAVLALPTGLALTGANALNVVQAFGRQKLPGKASKRQWQKKTGIDPWSKKGGIKYARHLVKSFPVKAGILQALQTTNEIFGVGLSLGPIVGLFIDSIAGPVRGIFGAPVKVDYNIPTFDEVTHASQEFLRNNPAYYYTPLQTSDEEVITMAMSHWLSMSTLYAGTKDVPGWENFQDHQDIEIRIRTPTNILTREVIQEEGLDPDTITVWPHNSKHWAPLTDIAAEYSAPAQDFFNEYTRLHDKDWLGFIYKTLTCDSTMYTLATAEGEDQVTEDYTAPAKAASILLENRLYPDPDQPAETLKLLADQLDLWELAGISPSLRDVLDFCDRNAVPLLPF